MPYDYHEYLSAFDQLKPLARVTHFAEVREAGRVFPLIRLDLEGDRLLLVTAGFHGEEPAGPLTLRHHLATLIGEAKQLGIGLRVYPCINPSGFEVGQRYNLSGEKPNNDFLRYEADDGTWHDSWTTARPYHRWQLFRGGPKETQALRADLETLMRIQSPAAALDIHQDNYLSEALSYVYVFAPRDVYLPLQAEAEKYVSIARNYRVDENRTSDGDGLIIYHDGSISDYVYRSGVPYVATLETTTCTPMTACEQVNLVWLRGFMALTAGKSLGAR